MSLMPVLSITFTVQVKFTVLSRCELGVLRPVLENEENLSHGFLSEIRDSNPGPPSYPAQVPVATPLQPSLCPQYCQLCCVKGTHMHSFSIA